MIYLLIFIILLMKESEGEWKLVWNEEFQNQTLDTEKWEIQNELLSCHGNYIKQLNCNTNSTRNLRLIYGTLAITAIHEKYLDKDYTSGKIATKQNFTYGRFEIRAALPKGKLLRPAMFMNPKPYAYSPNWAINGQIDIMTNIQTQKLGVGLHYNKPAQSDSFNDYITNKILNDFHIYALEWNESTIKWFLDDINYQTINISRNFGRSVYTKNGEPFDKPFKLFINLGVGGVNSEEVLTVEDVMNWKCSLLIIDYVRIYQSVVNHTEKENLIPNKASAEKICSTVMPLISLKKESDKMVTIGISVTCLLLLLAFIIIIRFLLIKQKKQKMIKIQNKSDVYDDTRVYSPYDYDVINNGCEYTLLRPETMDNYVECDGYEKIELKENINSQPIYLDMTCKKKNFTEQ